MIARIIARFTRKAAQDFTAADAIIDSWYDNRDYEQYV